MSEERTVVDVPAETRDDAYPLSFGERWRVLAMLGSGGMGSVYLARDSELDDLVALKVVRSDLASVPGMMERFRDEVRISRAVSSPFVARTHDLAENAGRVFLTMEYIEGETLSARLRREGALPLADVVRIARDVCAGLSAVHAAGVVHRDLKPANVLLAKDGRAVITDFGIALRVNGAEPGARSDGSGTPTYAAPEQLAGGAVDARADIYALGALLYAAATGQKPFGAARTGREPAPDPRVVSSQLPEAFATVVVRAMSPAPESRYASASAVSDALAPLANFGARVESRLFEFVRSIANASRSVAIELACDGATEVVREAVAHHLASRLCESGEVRVAPDRGAAEAMIEGAVTLRDGRCTLRLALRSSEGDVFWRASTEGSAAALASLVDAAATSIARALAVDARPKGDVTFASEEAARLFLEARAEYRRALRPHVERAVQLLERVDQLEPNNPTVLAWRAAALTRRRFFGDAPDFARELVDRALALGSREAIPYIALGEACMSDMRVVEAVRAYVTGMRLAPGVFDSRARFASLLSELGATEPALRITTLLRAEQPSYVGPLDVSMRVSALRGRFHETRAIHQGIADDAMGIHILNVMALRYASWNRDTEEFQRVGKKLDLRHADQGTRDIFERMCGALLEGKPQPPIDEGVVRAMTPRRRGIAFQISCELFAYLRDDAHFFESLDRAVASGVFDAPWIDSCPLFEPYRGSLHFETARRAIGNRAYEALVEIDRCLGEPPP